VPYPSAGIIIEAIERTLEQLNAAKHVNSEARKEALLWAHWRMAHPLDHGEYPEFEIISILRLEQIACATDMTLFGYDQGVFSMYMVQSILPIG
jgi:hypothetical protein